MGITIIAEAGVNHNGDPALVMRMIDVAKACGCDFIKFQTFRTEALVTRQAEKAAYQKQNTGNADTQFEMLRKLELPHEVFREARDYCKKVGIGFLSTPFDEESAFDLDALGMEMFKLSSGDITNKPLLQTIASLHKPMILSTGMCTLEEVRDAVSWVEACGERRITLLHCTSNYPTPYSDVNMRAMLTLRETFSYPVGYSDHTQGITIPIMAASMGATMIEKHFTLDKQMPGPDHKASLDPTELKAMTEAIRIVEAAMGNGTKAPTTGELSTRIAARKSIVAKRDLPCGTVLTAEDLAMKRPGTGLSPAEAEQLIGKRLACSVKADQTLLWAHIEG